MKIVAARCFDEAAVAAFGPAARVKFGFKYGEAVCPKDDSSSVASLKGIGKNFCLVIGVCVFCCGI
jgi:hypothetical protein